jgi:hypothetical protein
VDALATRLALFMEADVKKMQSLDDVINILEIDKAAKKQLRNILSDLQEVLDASDYESSDDDDKEDIITELKSDFYSILSVELQKIEDKI